MDGIAKGSELEDTSKGMLSGPLWPVLQMPREGKDLPSGHSGWKLELGLAFRVGCFPSAMWSSGRPKGAQSKRSGTLHEATSSRESSRVSSSRK